MKQAQINDYHHQYIAEFLERTADPEDEISGSLKATITQFIMNFRMQIKRKAKQRNEGWLSPEDIIDSQIDELRRCVIDLCTYKERLIKGVSEQ